MSQQSGGQLRPGINVRVNSEYPKHCKLYMIQKVMQSKTSGCLLDASPLLPLQITVKLVTEGMDAAPVRVPVEGVCGSV